VKASWIARKAIVPVAACLAIAFASGCQNGPMIGRMHQSQLESERLLSEFRAQKKENEQLREDRNRLLQQQAETEKLAARLQAQLNSNRPLNASNQRALADRGLPSNPLADRSIPDRSGLNSRSKTVSSGSSAGSENRENAEPRSASNSDSLQWRPIRKATR
jgi:hypothetical protein